MSERNYKSIGEVLGQLLEEFPNVTISKIRFLESQGLIEPERTPSGYRKFSESEVERLRYILREQETNYLPLRVIRDRLDESGTILRDPSSGLMQLPRALREQTVVDASEELPRVRPNLSTMPIGDETGDIEIVDASLTLASERVHPAGRRSGLRASPKVVVPAINSVRRGGYLAHDEMLKQSGLDEADVAGLIQYGLISQNLVGGEMLYDSSAIDVAMVARSFLDLGIEIRHLKAWRLAAEKEATLFEQRLLPFLRQRNPAAREQSGEILESLVANAALLRQLLVRQAVEKFLDPR